MVKDLEEALAKVDSYKWVDLSAPAPKGAKALPITMSYTYKLTRDS